MWAPSCGPSVASLQPRPARSYTQTLLSRATAGAVQPRSEEAAPPPGSRTTVGCPSRCSARAAGAHPRQPAGQAWDRPSRRATPARSHSRCEVDRQTRWRRATWSPGGQLDRWVKNGESVVPRRGQYGRYGSIRVADPRQAKSESPRRIRQRAQATRYGSWIPSHCVRFRVDASDKPSAGLTGCRLSARGCSRRS
jgi:hypothetical protein